jgi:hypothetical protein
MMAVGCSPKEARVELLASNARAVHHHEHKAPHDGTPIVLGDEVYHLELVLDADAGKLSAFVLDGEMENFIRVPTTSFEVVPTAGGPNEPLVFHAMADPATGETVGDTAVFEANAEWLKTAVTFDAMVTRLEVRGTTFTAVAFNFPRGNEK